MAAVEVGGGLPSALARAAAAREGPSRAESSVAVAGTSSPPLSLSELLRQAEFLAVHIANAIQLLPGGDAPAPGGEVAIVGLWLPRSVEWIIGAIASLTAGCIFLPLDPGWSRDTLLGVMADASPAAILTLLGVSPEAAERQKVPVLHISYKYGSGRLQVQPSAATAARQRACSAQGRRPSVHFAAGGDLCYLLYTSGSTGRPKGVYGRQSSLLSRCRWQEQQYPFTASDAVAWTSAPSFVDCMWQVFGPLVAGVRLVVLPDLRQAGGGLRALPTLLLQHNVTHLTLVPSVADAIMRASPVGADLPLASSLRLLMLSGEPLSWRCARQVLADLVGAGCRVLNLYGCSEAAADSAWAEVPTGPTDSDPADAYVPVGRPLAGTVLMVCQVRRDATASGADVLEVAPTGQEGRIVVCGVGVAAGYRSAKQPSGGGRPFVRLAVVPEASKAQHNRSLAAGDQPHGDSDPLAPASWPPAIAQLAGDISESCHGWRCFVTGDRGKMDSAGVLHFCGREDLRVKVSGVWVDLGALEIKLLGMPSVAEVAVRVLPGAGRVQAAAYVVLHPDSKESVAVRVGRPSQELLERAHQCLLKGLQGPETALASLLCAVIPLECLPKSAAGKVLRSNLPLPDGQYVSTRTSNGSHGMQPLSKRSRPNEMSVGTRVARDRTAGLVGGTSRHPGGEAAVMAAFLQALPQRPATAPLEPTSDFFLSGGDSLAALQVASALGTSVTLVAAHPTARALSHFLTGQPTRRHPTAARSHSEHSVEMGGSAAPVLVDTEPVRWMDTEELVASVATDDESVGDAEPDDPDAGAAVPPWPALSGRQPHMIVHRCGRVLATCCGDVGAHGTLSARQRSNGDECLPGQRGDSSACMSNNESHPPGTAEAARVCSFSLLDKAPTAAQLPGKNLRCLWRRHLGLCVDASPVLVVPRVSSSPGGHSRPALPPGTVVLCCSHSGVVQMLQGSDGSVIWRAKLPARTDSGVAVTRDLSFCAVGCGNGSVYFMNYQSGDTVASWDAGGEIRAAPVADPNERRVVWLTSHGCRLAALVPPGAPGGEVTCLWQISEEDCPAPVSCPPAIDPSRCRVCLAALDGRLVAVTATYRKRTTANVCAPEVKGQVAWVYRMPAPVLSAPVIVESSGAVVAVAVNGSARAVCPNGSALWSVELGSPCFAPVCVVESQQPLVLLTTQTGGVAAIRQSDGVCAWRHELRAGPCSSAPSPAMTSDNLQQFPDTMWCVSNAGIVQLISFPLGPAPGVKGKDESDRLPAKARAVQLPAQSFTSPVSAGSVSFVGCRDNFLYCLAAL